MRKESTKQYVTQIVEADIEFWNGMSSFDLSQSNGQHYVHILSVINRESADIYSATTFLDKQITEIQRKMVGIDEAAKNTYSMRLSKLKHIKDYLEGMEIVKVEETPKVKVRKDPNKLLKEALLRDYVKPLDEKPKELPVVTPVEPPVVIPVVIEEEKVEIPVEPDPIVEVVEEVVEEVIQEPEVEEIIDEEEILEEPVIITEPIVTQPLIHEMAKKPVGELKNNGYIVGTKSGVDIQASTCVTYKDTQGNIFCTSGLVNLSMWLNRHSCDNYRPD